MRSEEVPVLVVGGAPLGSPPRRRLARQGGPPPARQREARDHRTCRKRTSQPAGDGGARGLSASPTRSPSAARRPSQMAATAYYAGFAGPEPDYGRRLARLECWGAGGENEQLARGEPVAPAQPSADPSRADPQGRRRDALAGPRSASTTSCSSSSRTRTACRRSIRDNGTGEEYVGALPSTCSARTADASCASMIGVGYEGLGVLTQTATLHVTADFSRVGRRSRRPHPLDRLAAGRRAGRHGPDGPRALGARLGGVGHPPQLPGRRPQRAVRRAGRGRRSRGDRARPTPR